MHNLLTKVCTMRSEDYTVLKMMLSSLSICTKSKFYKPDKNIERPKTKLTLLTQRLTSGIFVQAGVHFPRSDIFVIYRAFKNLMLVPYCTASI